MNDSMNESAMEEAWVLYMRTRAELMDLARRCATLSPHSWRDYYRKWRVAPGSRLLQSMRMAWRARSDRRKGACDG